MDQTKRVDQRTPLSYMSVNVWHGQILIEGLHQPINPSRQGCWIMFIHKRSIGSYTTVRKPAETPALTSMPANIKCQPESIEWSISSSPHGLLSVEPPSRTDEQEEATKGKGRDATLLVTFSSIFYNLSLTKDSHTTRKFCCNAPTPPVDFAVYKVFMSL